MALTATFTSYPTEVVSPDFHVVVEFSQAILPTTFVGTDFRLRRQDGQFNNPGLGDVDFYTDDNTTFVCVFHVDSQIVADAQYLVRLPANRVQYLDAGDNVNGPDATINTPQFPIQDLRTLSGSIAFSESEGEVGTAVTATLTFNQAVSGIIPSDFSVVDGTLGSEVTQVSDSEYTVQVTPAAGDGTMTLTFAENGTYEGNSAISADLSYTGEVADPLTFGSESIANQLWEVGTAESLTLPEATGGEGTTTYSLSPTLPDGVTFTAGTRVLAGTPTGRFSSATFTYTATNGTESVSLTFTIAVTAPAITFASTIAHQSWEVGTAVSLTLPTATGGVGTLTYTLTGTLPGGVTFTPGTRVLAGTPTGRFSSASFTYTATDAENITHTQTFTIVVTADAISFASTIANQTWTVGTAVSLTLPTASGGVGTFTYSLSPTPPAGVTFTAGTRVLAGTPTAALSSATFTYTATDTENITQTQTFTIVVEAAVALAWVVPGVDVGNTFSATLTSNYPLTGFEVGDFRLRDDDNSDPVIPLTGSNTTITQVAGTNNLRLDLELTGTYDDDYTIRINGGAVTANGMSVPSAQLASSAFRIDSSVGLDPLAVGTVNDRFWDVGETINYTLPEATGGSGINTYTLSPTLPAGLTFNATARTITGIPTLGFERAEFTYTVTDSVGTTVSRTFDIQVTATAIVFSPSTVMDRLWRVGDTVSLILPSATGGAGTLAYSLTPALSAGLSFDASARSITGSPTAAAAATTYTITATDAVDATAEIEFSITIEAAVVIPVVDFGTQTIANQDYDIGVAVNVEFPEATGGNGTLEYGFSPALPAGLSFDQSTRTLTGTVNASYAQRTYLYIATEDISLVIDGNGDLIGDADFQDLMDAEASDALEFHLQVTGALLFAGTVPEQFWIRDEPVDLTLPEATGGTGVITYTLSPALPAGATLTDRVISGAPTAIVAQTLYTWRATDADSNAVVLTFHVSVNNPIVFLTDYIPDQMYTIGEPVDFTLPAATDGTTGTITLSLTPALPTGLSFDRMTRELIGTPREIIGGRLYTYTARNAVTLAALTFKIFVQATAYTLANRELQTLLPPNATEWELAVESVLRENFLPIDGNDHIKMPIIDAWNPDEIPAHVLPYLGINLSIVVDNALPEQEQRSLLKSAFGIHSYEGTPQALLDIIHALGYAGAAIQEGVEDPADMSTHWAHYSILINQPITIAEAQRMVELVKDAAPQRCTLVSVDVSASAQVYDGSFTYDGTHNYGQIDAVSGLNL